MLRSGQFDNLQWNKLAEAHTANWELLQTKYGLSLQQTISTASLSEVAVQSIQDCWEYLFTDGAKCRTGWQTGSPLGILSAEVLKELLAPDLCNHLLVTFAYRFFCDNLSPRTLPECLDTVYGCLNDSLRIKYKYKYKRKETDKATGQETKIPVEDKDGMRELRSNFMKPKERSCGAYDEKINAVLSHCGQELQDLYSRLISEAVDLTPQVNSDLLLIKKEAIIRAGELYAAPNWAYSISMACTWTNSPLAEKGGRLVFARDYHNQDNLLNRLTYFLGSSEWGPILFGEATPGSKRSAHFAYKPASQTKETLDEMERWQLQVSPSLMELRSGSDNQDFVSVPYVKEQTYRHSLPPQSYAIIGSDSRYEIPSEVQQMLNCYLVERTFHGYASVIAIEYIKRRQTFHLFDYYRQQYEMLSATVRLRAPLLHPAWIRLTDYLIGETGQSETAIPWIEGHIDYWNHFALPILEEHFIQNVWSRYREDSIDVVLAEIEKALMQDDGEARRCDRLNFYRLMPVSDNSQKPKKDDVFNEVMKNAYLAGLGFKLGQDHGRYIDLGRAMAFDEI